MKVDKDCVEKTGRAIRRAVRAARSGREAEQAIKRAGIPVNNITVRPHGAFGFRIWFKLAGDDAMQEVLCSCDVVPE